MSIDSFDGVSALTLDQFLVFAAVVDHGGFAAAGRKLGRAQSAITHAIRALEEHSGVLLFDRSAYRPVLTDAGRALLPRARRLVADLDDFRRQTEGFSRGLEANLTLVADVFAPLGPLTHALQTLHATYPSVRVRLVLEPYARAIELMRSGEAQFGILIRVAALGHEFEWDQLQEHELVAVAAPTHPLANAPSPISAEQLGAHFQLVYAPASAPPDNPDFGVHALDKWYVTDPQAKLQFLRAGLGWGSMPDHMVADDLEAGRLVKLEPQRWEGSDRMPRFTTHLVLHRKAVLGPAGRFLIEALRPAYRPSAARARDS